MNILVDKYFNKLKYPNIHYTLQQSLLLLKVPHTLGRVAPMVKSGLKQLKTGKMVAGG